MSWQDKGWMSVGIEEGNGSEYVHSALRIPAIAKNKKK